MKRTAILLAAILGLGALVWAQNPLLINGAGATFPNPIYSKWFDVYHQKNGNIQFNYASVGSGAGIKQVTDGTVDFGASDGPMNDEQLKAYQDKHGFPILHFPTVLGAVVPTYNVPGLSGALNFTPEALAGIYLGKITKWNDPIIKRANRGVSLPDANIIVVHRSDSSGTTHVWSDYLSKISPEWKAAVGAGMTLKWPVGMGTEYNEGIAATVQRTPHSIGYVELVYAIRHQLSFGAVRNAAGEYIRANLESVTAAASAMAGDPASITNASGKDSYPIAASTFLLWPKQVKDSKKKAALLELLQWALTNGQKEC